MHCTSLERIADGWCTARVGWTRAAMGVCSVRSFAPHGPSQTSNLPRPSSAMVVSVCHVCPMSVVDRDRNTGERTNINIINS